MFAALGVALLCAAAVVIYILGLKTPPAHDTVMMKEGETRLVESYLTKKGRNIEFDRAVSEEPSRVKASRFPSLWWPRPTIVKVTALTQAPEGVDIKLYAGDGQVQTLTVAVNGQTQLESDIYYGDKTPDEKRRRARSLIDQGRAARPTHVYRAVRLFGRAMAVTGDLPYRPKEWHEAHELAKEADGELKRQFKRLDFQVNNRRWMRDYKGMARGLLGVMRLIDDPHDLRHQEARIIFNGLRRRGALRE